MRRAPALPTGNGFQHAMGWTQANLGSLDDARQVKLYGITACPSYWLIGRDGNVLANDWQVDALRPCLAQALDNR